MVALAAIDVLFSSCVADFQPGNGHDLKMLDNQVHVIF